MVHRVYTVPYIYISCAESTIDQELAYVADASSSLTRWQHFSAWNDVMAAILNVWRRMENTTLPVDAHLRKEQFCQISSRSDLKQRSLGAFWKSIAPTITRRRRTRWVAIWDQFLI